MAQQVVVLLIQPSAILDEVQKDQTFEEKLGATVGVG